MNHSNLYKMSRNTYLSAKDREDLAGWDTVTELSDNDGLMFIYYKNEESKEIVFAFRGTDMSRLNNLVSNLWINMGLLLGKSPNRMENVAQIVQKKISTNFLKNIFDYLRGGHYKWYFTGHDLGGILAISEAVNHFSLLKNNLKEVVVFEIQGCQHLVPMNINLNLTVYLSSPNLINTRGKHIPGTVKHLLVSFREDEGDLFASYQEKFKHVCHSIINIVVSVAMIGLFLDYVISHFLEEEKPTILLAAMAYSLFSPLFSLMEKALPAKPEVLLKSVLSIAPTNPVAMFLRSWFLGLNTDTAFPWMVVLFLVAVYSVVACQEWERILKQHPIKAMDNKFRAAAVDGLPQGVMDMESWPTGEQLALYCLGSPFRFFNLGSRSQPGIRTIFSSAKEIELARNRQISGFKERKGIENPVVFRRLGLNV